MKTRDKFVTGGIVVLSMLTIFTLVFGISDEIGNDKLTGKATVVSRRHTNADTTLFVLEGGVVVPQDHPEKWELGLRLDGSNSSGYVGVSKEAYEIIQDGTQVVISYSVGRWSRNLYISAVRIN